MPETLLIIDDNPSQLRTTEQVVQQKLRYNTLTAGSEEEAIRGMRSDKQRKPDLALLDFSNFNAQGMSVVRAIKSHHPQLPVIVFTPYGDHATVVNAVQAGADDFLTKPVSVERLGLTIQNAIKIQRMKNYIGWLERRVAGHMDFSDILGDSAAFREAMAQAEVAASSNMPVLIEGEPGAGKELFARAIHGGGARANKPFVAINCELLPDALAEAMLFGQEKDLPPGKLHFAQGKLREADQGTLLFEEIHMLKPELQLRLLEALETGAVSPVGSNSKIPVDLRIICANSEPVARYVEQGKFHSKLYHKLKNLFIHVPPLRDRKSDIELLADHFVTIYAVSENKIIRGLNGGARQWLSAQPWPGNVGQLTNLLWRSVLLCDDEALDVAHLQMAQKTRTAQFANHARAETNGASAMVDERGQVKTLKSVQEEAIRFALEYSGGCMTRAARSLGIGRSTLYRKVNEFAKTG